MIDPLTGTIYTRGRNDGSTGDLEAVDRLHGRVFPQR